MAETQLFLTDVPRALAPFGAHATYQQLWGAAVAGRIPAERVGRKWTIRTADLATIAKTFTDA
jgi:hypothetical protein